MAHRDCDEQIVRKAKDAQRNLLALGVRLEHKVPSAEDPLHRPVTQLLQANVDMVDILGKLCNALEKAERQIVTQATDVDSANGYAFALEQQNKQLEKDLQAAQVVINNIAVQQRARVTPAVVIQDDERVRVWNSKVSRQLDEKIKHEKAPRLRIPVGIRCFRELLE